jgi:hypothetical protein
VSALLPARAQPSAPAPAAATASAPPAATDFQLTPRNAQDDVQQWFDRYECDSWARWQGSRIPLGGETGPSEEPAYEEYRRAMVACLSQRGYDVRYAPRQPTPSAPTYGWLGKRRTAPRELQYRPFSLQAGGGYSAPAGSATGYVNSGANAGAALTWFPGSALPLGVRIEGSYTWFKPGSELLALNNAGYNTGERDLYGGDVGLRLNLSPLPAGQQLYLLGGAGRYRIDTLLQDIHRVLVCGRRFCGIYSTLLAQEHDVTPWEPSWNAGLGWEVALDDHTSFFIEARYRYIRAYGNAMRVVPIWLGLRF